MLLFVLFRGGGISLAVFVRGGCKSAIRIEEGPLHPSDTYCTTAAIHPFRPFHSHPNEKKKTTNQKKKNHGALLVPRGAADRSRRRRRQQQHLQQQL
jgi:hypothetical protein